MAAAMTVLAFQSFNSTLFIERDAAEFAIVFREVNGRHDDIVLGHSVRGQPRDQVIDGAEGAGGRRMPRLIANADGLGDPDALSGPQSRQERRQLGIHWTRR